MKAASNEKAARADTSGLARSRRTTAARRTTTMPAVSTISGANACQSMVGLTHVAAARSPITCSVPQVTDGRGDGLDGRIGDVEHQAGDEAEQDDQQQDR